MAHKQRKDSILKLRISDNLKTEAEFVAKKKGESLSVVIREALRQYLDREESGEQKPLAEMESKANATSSHLTSEQADSLQQLLEAAAKLQESGVTYKNDNQEFFNLGEPSPHSHEDPNDETCD